MTRVNIQQHNIDTEREFIDCSEGFDSFESGSDEAVDRNKELLPKPG